MVYVGGWVGSLLEDSMLRGRVLIVVSALVLAALLPAERPAAAEEPSPDALAAARELVAASRAANNLKVLLPLIMQQLKPAVVQGRAEVGRDYDALMPQLIEEFATRSDAFVDGIAFVYARNFTADELRELASFYRSPIGQAFLEKMPTIFKESASVGQKFGEAIAGKLRSRMIEELRKRGHSI
jgi:hypothetical protein